MHWCAVSSAKPIVLYESKIIAFLTRLRPVWYDEGGGSRESQQIHLRFSLCCLCSGALGTGRHPRLVLPRSSSFLVFKTKGNEVFPFVVSSDKPEDDKPGTKRQQLFFPWGITA